MACAGIAAGSTLRPNSSLAPSFGSAGLASGGNGFGSTLPLSCASAAEANGTSKRARIRRSFIGRFYIAAVAENQQPRRESRDRDGMRAGASYLSPQAGRGEKKPRLLLPRGPAF